MQLMVLQFISGMVKNAVRQLFYSMKEAWLESENEGEDEFILSSVSIKGQNGLT